MSLTKTYMEVGKPKVIRVAAARGEQAAQTCVIALSVQLTFWSCSGLAHGGDHVVSQHVMAVWQNCQCG
jgi:hypothetical protein